MKTYNSLNDFASTNRDTRLKLITEGDICLCEPNEYSLALVSNLTQMIKKTFNTNDIRTIHKRHSNEDIFLKMGTLRRDFFNDKLSQKLTFKLLEANGFNLNHVLLDPFKLRTVMPGEGDNPKAAPTYYCHRDTWYAHSGSTINVWIPLHDVTTEETFAFYPDYFDKSVPNNSDIFDYSEWKANWTEYIIGWQKIDTSERVEYPKLAQDYEPEGKTRFSANKGQILFFSANHLHQTLMLHSDYTRFSFDFRIIDKTDIQHGLSAPCKDNKCKGADIRIKDYISYESTYTI